MSDAMNSDVSIVACFIPKWSFQMFEVCEQEAMAGRTAGGSSVCCRPGLAVTAWLASAFLLFCALFVLDNFGVSIPPDRLPQMG